MHGRYQSQARHALVVRGARSGEPGTHAVQSVDMDSELPASLGPEMTQSR